MNQISNEAPSSKFRIIPQFPNHPNILWVECPGCEAGRFGVGIYWGFDVCLLVLAGNPGLGIWQFSRSSPKAAPFFWNYDRASRGHEQGLAQAFFHHRAEALGREPRGGLFFHAASGPENYHADWHSKVATVIVRAKEREWKFRIQVDNPHIFSYFGLG